MRPQAAPVEVLNDINADLVTLYRVVQNHLEEFVRQFKWALSSRQVFEWQKMTRPETLTDIQRAARFFYLQHHAFAGKVSGQTFGTATTAPAINLLRIEENLSAAWQRLSGTYVELPWLECAERYDRAHTFHYMDPPYWQTAGYGVDFPFENYERMADFMRRCKGKVMVSINDHPDIRRVFDGFHFETLDIRYATTNQRQAKADVSGELVFMNCMSVLVCPEKWARRYLRQYGEGCRTSLKKGKQCASLLRNLQDTFSRLSDFFHIN